MSDILLDSCPVGNVELGVVGGVDGFKVEAEQVKRVVREGGSAEGGGGTPPFGGRGGIAFVGGVDGIGYEGGRLSSLIGCRGWPFSS